jgi:SAM-dependent methyltransferase
MIQRRGKNGRTHVPVPARVAPAPTPAPTLIPPTGPWPRLDDATVPLSFVPAPLLKAADILEHKLYSKPSLDILSSLKVGTFHHHTHILLPILDLVQAKTYLEIGSFAGASAILATYAETVTDIYAIDTCDALPNQAQVIRDNVNTKRNPKSTAQFTLYPTSSQNRVLLRHLYADKRAPFVDVLFIDGDHSFQGLAKDVEQYMALVRPGGIIVIDDYQDAKSCPDVKRCVDTLLPRWKALYGVSVIGSLPNTAKAFSNGSPNLQKPLLPLNPPLIGIPIATYQRGNGSTPGKVLRTLNAVKRQTCQSWCVFLIGDAYGNHDEFLGLAKQSGIPAHQIISINLPIACEREFIQGQTNQINSLLWKLAGATAMNYGLEMVRLAGISLVAHLDDDDTWAPNHLSLLMSNMSKYPRTVVSYAKGKEAGTNVILPAENGPDTLPVRLYNNFHSSVMWNVKLVPLRYNIYQTYPADADMWERMRVYCEKHGFRMIYSPTITMEKN